MCVDNNLRAHIYSLIERYFFYLRLSDNQKQFIYKQFNRGLIEILQPPAKTELHFWPICPVYQILIQIIANDF